MFFGLFENKKKANNRIFYVILIVAILALILAILGSGLVKDVLFPLILSGIWHFVLKAVKNSVKSLFFND